MSSLPLPDSGFERRILPLDSRTVLSLSSQSATAKTANNWALPILSLTNWVTNRFLTHWWTSHTSRNQSQVTLRLMIGQSVCLGVEPRFCLSGIKNVSTNPLENIVHLLLWCVSRRRLGTAQKTLLLCCSLRVITYHRMISISLFFRCLTTGRNTAYNHELEMINIVLMLNQFTPWKRMWECVSRTTSSRYGH
jgi:hypothetical protein